VNGRLPTAEAIKLTKNPAFFTERSRGARRRRTHSARSASAELGIKQIEVVQFVPHVLLASFGRGCIPIVILSYDFKIESEFSPLGGNERSYFTGKFIVSKWISLERG
jgi:hypothetical protein